MLAEQIYHFEHELMYYECDQTGRLSVEMMVALMIAASEGQNAQLGFDENAAQEFNGGWVIINYDTEIMGDLPQAGDRVQIDTRVAAFNRFFVMREWKLLDKAGQCLAKVRGLFAFMDLQKRRMAPIPEAMLGPYSDQMVKRLPKLKSPAKSDLTDDWTGQDYHVRYYDIDANRHVNNARYFEWLLDPLPADFLLSHRPTAFQMNYHREVRMGETIQSYVSPISEQDGLLISHHRIQLGDQLCALAEFHWQKI